MEPIITTESHVHTAIKNDMGNRHPRILFAEDDHTIRSSVENALQGAGYETVVCRDGLDLLDRIDSFFFPVSERNETFDLIIADLHLPVVSGMEILEGMQHIKGFPPMILISPSDMDQTCQDAERLGAAAIFKKPFEPGALLSRVNHIFDGKEENFRQDRQMRKVFQN